MRMFQPLRHRNISLLWGGQVLSSIGDELNRVAFVWLAAGLLGKDSGYLVSIQAASVFVLSVFGGVVADRWDHKRTMIWVDIVRGLAVLALPLAALFGPPNLFILVTVAIVASGLNALFSPALRAFVPEVASDKGLLQATNGLMETTGRFARIIGPGLIGVLSGVFPLMQFFTLDAVTFFVSAASIALIKTKSETRTAIPVEEKLSILGSFKEGVVAGWRLLKTNPLLKYIILTNGPVNSAWYLIFPLTLGLQLHESMPENVAALGLVISAYGVGNVLTNLVVGNIQMTNPVLVSWIGRASCGLGFIALAFAPSLPWMMAASAFAATGGPMIDLAFMTLLQKDYKGRDIARLYRLDMAMSYGALLIVCVVSPLLFRLVSYRTVTCVCGAVMIFVALVGSATFSKTKVLAN